MDKRTKKQTNSQKHVRLVVSYMQFDTN